MKFNICQATWKKWVQHSDEVATTDGPVSFSPSHSQANLASPFPVASAFPPFLSLTGFPQEPSSWLWGGLWARLSCIVAATIRPSSVVWVCFWLLKLHLFLVSPHPSGDITLGTGRWDLFQGCFEFPVHSCTIIQQL